MLVASGLKEDAQRDYVKQTFTWYYDRSRFLIGSLAALAVGLAAAAASDKPGDRATFGLKVAAVLVLILLARSIVNRVLITPLHREYLCCLDLLEQLRPFQRELQMVRRTAGQPDPHLRGNVFRRTVSFRGKYLPARIKHAAHKFSRRADESSSAAVGRYLFEVLGPVPTDDYERRRNVHLCVNTLLRKAAVDAPTKRGPQAAVAGDATMRPVFPILTNRLELRPYVPDDIPRIHTVLYGDVRARRLTGGVSSLAETQASIERYITLQERKGYSFWAVIEQKTGELVGEAGLKLLDDKGPEVELGYAFAPQAWGKGFATEAGEAVLRAAFGELSLNRIVAVTEVENATSQQVLAKLGFRQEGKRPSYGKELPYFVREREPGTG